MDATQAGTDLANYRYAVTELISAGEPFEDVEEAIDGIVGLTPDRKASLWLFAFSLRDRHEHQSDVRADLAAIHLVG